MYPPPGPSRRPLGVDGGMALYFAEKNGLLQMINTLSGKRKLFAEAILKGEAPHSAAIQAGYSERSSYQSASRLLKEPDITKAIRQAFAAKETTLNQLDEARILALTTRDATACVRAIELEAKIHGVIE